MHNELSRAAVAASHSTCGIGGRRLQPVLHVAIRVVPAAQHLAAWRHRLVGQVLEQVVQQARVACALTHRECRSKCRIFKLLARVLSSRTRSPGTRRCVSQVWWKRRCA
jgi:hypothetical protein